MNLGVSVEVTGLDELGEALERMAERGPSAATKVLRAAAEQAVKIAKPLTPVAIEEGGLLRDSVRFEGPKVERGVVSVDIVAGGAPLVAASALREDYAYEQHEDVTLKHTTGGPKFIERAVYQVTPSIPGELQAEIGRGKD